MKKLFSGILALSLVLCVLFAGSVLVSAEETNAAKIGDAEYATLAEAVKAVPKGATANPTTITLLKDQNISSLMVGHQYPQNIIVDLNGYTLSSNAIVLTAYRSGTTLTVRNGTISGNSTSGTLRATYGGHIVLGDNLTVNGAGGSATLVYVDNGSVEIAAENGVAFTGGKLDFKQSTNVNNVISVAASNGRTYFGNLTDALAAANDGNTVTLQDNVTLENTVLTINKDLTIDFNGHTVTGKFGETTSNSEVNGSLVTAVNQFVLIENAEVTLKDSVGTGGLDADVAAYGNLSNLIRVATTGKLTIESGNYHQNLSVVGAGMIDSRGSDNITVKGGNFKLDNVGTQSNGSPWIFNTSGRNSGHINVVGGTFNADVFHQYYVFEVQVPDELQGTLALSYDEETGTYTVVDAVAYVVEKHGNYEMKVGYATLEEASAACDVTDGKVAYRAGTYYASQQSESETIVLLQDINLGDSIVIS